MELIEITKSGIAAKPVNRLSDLTKEIKNSNADLYAAAYVPP
jgi:hypothetical protein